MMFFISRNIQMRYLFQKARRLITLEMTKISPNPSLEKRGIIGDFS